MQELSRKTILEAVRQHLPDVPSDAAVTRCRTGKFNTTFFVESDGQPGTVIRIAPPPETPILFYERNMMAQEPGLHRLLRERTGVPVPAIHAYDTSRSILDCDFLLMERLAGMSLAETFGQDETYVFHQVGKQLAEVHAIHAESYGYLGEHRPMAPQSSWREAFRIMWDKLVDDTVGCGGYSADEAKAMRLLLERHDHLFERDVPASLLHMDIWHQNILADEDGTVTGIVDWDRALWGDPEIEFAVFDYCGVSVPAFWEGYGRSRDTSREGLIRNRFYLLYELQKYILINRARRADPQRGDLYKRQVFKLAAELIDG